VPSLFNGHDRDAVLARIAHLSPTSQPLWGRFTAGEMVCHVSCELRQALGDMETPPPAGPLAYPPLNWLAIHVLPWPRGKGKSPPEWLGTRPTTWDADLARLRELIKRFAARGPAAEWPPSQVFGRIGGAGWGALAHKHLDYHLRQFGV
jgi:hypothetical protein